jgi:hypothetical protein
MRVRIIRCVGAWVMVACGAGFSGRLESMVVSASTERVVGASAEAWNTFDADVTVRTGRVASDGSPIGEPAPAAQYHWERRLTASGWRTAMTVFATPGPTVRSLSGEKRLDNPFTISRIEDDEDGTPLRLFDRAGHRVTTVADADWSPSTDPGNLGSGIDATRMATAVRPLSFGRDWMDAIVASPSKAVDRRAALERRLGKATGRVRGLDRFLAIRGDETVEVLVDSASSLVAEVNVVRDSALVAHTTFSFVPAANGSFVRRALHSEHTVPGTSGERSVIDVEITNVRLVQGK